MTTIETKILMHGSIFLLEELHVGEFFIFDKDDPCFPNNLELVFRKISQEYAKHNVIMCVRHKDAIICNFSQKSCVIPVEPIENCQEFLIKDS